MKALESKQSSERAYADLLAGALKAAGWRVPRPAGPRSGRRELVADSGAQRYVIELKAARDARRDLLQALLADACLQARRHAQEAGGRPLAVVCAPRLSERVLGDLRAYAERFLSGCAHGFVDAEGRVELHGRGLERVRADADAASVATGPDWEQPPQLFGDLGRWLLKLLLASRIPAEFLHAPRVAIRNAKHLAEVAEVSVAAAWRQVGALKRAGFVDAASRELKLVRVGELLHQWAAASRSPGRVVRARWLLPPADGEHELRRALARYHEPRPARAAAAARPRACLGLHSACRHLGMGVVQGIPSSLYLEADFPGALQELGLRQSDPGDGYDVLLCIPRWPKSVFRGAVERGGVPAADAVQCWLDLVGHPARGEEQAREVWDRVLARVVE
ncbi:MAG: hypothetical protein HYZ53_09060 [Planctomycetes bacterium]|nr:hypothetical protein [Planctomycetota bacterium]